MSEYSVDQELVRRVQQGDKSAYDILVLKYQHKILKLISRYIRDPHEAQDVAQEAFIKAYRALAKFRGDSAFYTWLYRIATNTAKNYLIAQSRRPPGSDIEAADAEQYESAPGLRNIDSPELLVQKEQIERVIFQTIDELPEELRTAISLRELEGLSYDEISQAMECPVGTVRSRIFRAREAIDKNLRPLMEPD